jgi:hypothetical protein
LAPRNAAVDIPGGGDRDPPAVAIAGRSHAPPLPAAGDSQPPRRVGSAP